MKVFGVKISWDTLQLVSFVINPNQFLKENASSEREFVPALWYVETEREGWVAGRSTQQQVRESVVLFP